MQNFEIKQNYLKYSSLYSSIKTSASLLRFFASVFETPFGKL